MPEPMPEESELEKSLVAFKEQLPNLLAENEGRWAVGRAGDKFSCWDTYNDALQHAYNTYEPGQFIVQKVERNPTPQTMLSPIA
jgi:hypothetical protein